MTNYDDYISTKTRVFSTAVSKPIMGNANNRAKMYERKLLLQIKQFSSSNFMKVRSSGRFRHKHDLVRF